MNLPRRTTCIFQQGRAHSCLASTIVPSPPLAGTYISPLSNQAWARLSWSILYRKHVPSTMGLNTENLTAASLTLRLIWSFVRWDPALSHSLIIDYASRWLSRGTVASNLCHVPIAQPLCLCSVNRTVMRHTSSIRARVKEAYHGSAHNGVLTLATNNKTGLCVQWMV